MSNRELAIKLLNEIPESKMIFVVDILKSVKNMFIDEVKPDEWDLKMIQEAEKENNGEKVSFDEILKRDGLTYADLQNWIWKSSHKIFRKTR